MRQNGLTRIKTLAYLTTTCGEDISAIPSVCITSVYQNPFITQQRIQDKLHIEIPIANLNHILSTAAIYSPPHFTTIESLHFGELVDSNYFCKFTVVTLQQTKHLVSPLVQLIQNNYCFINEYGLCLSLLRIPQLLVWRSHSNRCKIKAHYTREGTEQTRTHIHRLHGNTTTSVCK